MNLLKLMSVGRIFLAIIALLFGVFLWTGVVSLMPSFGFETKDSLRTQLKTERAANKQMDQALTDNKSELQTIKSENERILKELEVLHAKEKALDKNELKIVTALVKKTQPARKIIDETTIITETTITMARKQVDIMSEANITALNEAYDSMIAGVVVTPVAISVSEVYYVGRTDPPEQNTTVLLFEIESTLQG